MKRSVALFAIIILIISFSLTAFSADINGVDEGAEWDGSTVIKLLDGESNCKVNFGLLKAKFDNETNAMYLCFMFSEPELQQDNTNIGLSLIIEDSEAFVITMSSTPVIYDIDKYSCSGAISVDENFGVTCEIRLGLKYGLPDEVNGSVRFIDSDGSPSNFYDFTVENDVYSETKTETEKYINLTDKSTKKSTASTETTKSSAVKTSKSEKITFPDFDFLFNDETTSIATKKANSKTTSKRSDKTSKNKKSTVRIIEKEIYISVVTEIVSENMLSNSVTDQSLNIASNDDPYGVLSTSEGSKYKTLTLIFGGIALVTIAVLGTLGSIKKDNDPKSE